MYKLNQKGWGLGMMITFLAVFFIALIIIAYLCKKYNVVVENQISIVFNLLK